MHESRTKRAKDDAKLNTGDFSERLWSAAVKKILSGEFSALSIFAAYVRMAGGAQAIGASLPEIRIESLHDGGLLVVATESPLPEDSEENRPFLP